VCYYAAGTYDAKLIAINAGGKDSVTFSNYMNVKPAPAAPYITLIGSTLCCNRDLSYASYQWSEGGILIPGATDTFLVVTQSGNYNVEVSNSNGCKIAVGINIVLGIGDYSKDNLFSLSPNPADNQLTIHTSYMHNETVTVSISNMLGEIMQEEKIKWSNDQIINIKNLSSGIYFLQMKTDSGSAVKRFLKQ